MTRSLVELANFTLLVEITFENRLRFKEDGRGWPILNDLAEEGRTLCEWDPGTLSALIEANALPQVIRTIWHVTCTEYHRGRTAGIAAERAWNQDLQRHQRTGKPVLTAPPDHQPNF